MCFSPFHIYHSLFFKLQTIFIQKIIIIIIITNNKMLLTVLCAKFLQKFAFIRI